MPISLSHHNATTRAMGVTKGGPSKLGICGDNYSFFKAVNTRVPVTNQHRTVGRGCHLKFRFGIRSDSMGANNPPMGLALNRSGNQEGRGGDVRGAVLNTTEQGARGGERGTRPLIYLFAPLLFQALEKKARKSAKRKREVITSQLAGTKRRISRRS